MHCEIVLTSHAFMHHEDAGFNNCAFARLEYHRTDGQLRRSAPLHDFDVRRFLETQCACASVGDFNGEGFIGVVFYIAVVNLLLIRCDGGRPAAIAAALVGEQE